MIEEPANPFAVTKAVDLSNEQIRDTWVDLPGAGSLLALGNPRSPMPMLLLGGKGSGRTHLLRYFSYAVQKLRHQNDLRGGFDRDQYVGIFVQCETLNAGRFSGKALTVEAWLAAFTYYMDIWLAQLALETLISLQQSLELPLNEASLLKSLVDLVDIRGHEAPETAVGFRALLRRFQLEVDAAVNNAPLRRTAPELFVRASPGRLVFDLPRHFLAHCAGLESYGAVYLLDEVENLSTEQQRYLNTLVRDKRYPITLKIGCRTHGLRTFETLRDGEHNRDGSEFERVELDHHFREKGAQYVDFARRVAAKRLSASGLISLSLAEIDRMKVEGLRRLIDDGFETFAVDDFDAAATSFIGDRYAQSEPPYLANLRTKLQDHATSLMRDGMLETPSEIDNVVTLLRSASVPLVQRANVFLLYKAWSDGKQIVASAQEIAESAAELLHSAGGGPLHRRLLERFRSDLLAQLLNECKQPQRYLGFETFVQMSSGFPRHLLIILKAVYRWATFNGEKPFEGKPVSMKSQQQGVLQASNWFFDDARVVGQDPAALQAAIERLAGLLRAMRYSDKPVEVSLSTFACDEGQLSDNARATLYAAEQTSLLLRVPGGHKNRNTRHVDACFQLNPMLAPRFDLPLARRGVVELSCEEVNAIFEATAISEFERLRHVRLARMTAPFSHTEMEPDEDLQLGLF